MAAKIKKPNPLEIAKAASGLRKSPKTWLDDLDPDTRDKIVEAARRIHNGVYTNKVAIVDAWRAAGIPATYNRLNCLLRKISEGAV